MLYEVITFALAHVMRPAARVPGIPSCSGEIRLTVAVIVRSRSAGLAGILPLRFRGKAVAVGIHVERQAAADIGIARFETVPLRKRVAEFQRIEPGHIVDRLVVAPVDTRVASRITSYNVCYTKLLRNTFTFVAIGIAKAKVLPSPCSLLNQT